MAHIPVFQKEVIEYLSPQSNENFVDATIGEGGHAAAILEKNGPNGKVLGVEIDFELYKKLKAAGVKSQKSKVKKRLNLVNDSYANLKEIVKKEKFEPVSGILFDLGMSTWHIEESGKGFTFKKDEPLDMRYDIQIQNSKRKSQNYPEQIRPHSIASSELRGKSELYWAGNAKFKIFKRDKLLTADKILNTWTEKEIREILKRYGEERFAKRIAAKIVEQRKNKPIKTTFQLKDIIGKATPVWYQHKRLHFAARAFQALRIAVNDELKNLEQVLPQTLEVLEAGARIVIISFHSLEDRIVKNFFRESQKKGLLRILTKKPLVPSLEEVEKNSKARSAKLRAAVIARL
jgi:16S rRNA (cytosine1402-N4)-methyltransferase